MESLREDFILDNQPGDYVTIMLQNGVEWTGTILDWNERRVRLEIGGVPRSVSFNIINAYYPAEAGTEPAVPPADSRPAAAACSTPAPTAAQLAAKRVEEAAYRIGFDTDLVQERLRLAPNTIEKERINLLFHRFLEASSPKSKDPMDIKRVMAAADKLSAQYPDSPLTQSIIGEMAMKLENWELAEECLFNGGSYARAFFAAGQLQSDDKTAEDGACHLLYENKKEPDAVYTFLRLAEKAGDLSVFRRFLRTEGDRYKALCADCLCYLLQKGGLPLPEGANIAEPTVIDAMSELFDRRYPDPNHCQMAVLDGTDEPEEEEELKKEEPITLPEMLPTDLTGYIYDYAPIRKIGRIHSKERPDWFFHINHITDPVLQGMMETDPEHRYLVTFDVGRNATGECAVNIRLTDKEHPYDTETDPSIRRSGVITRFFPTYMNGQITGGDEVFNFRVDEMTDQDLKDYCTIFPDVVQRKFDVTFSLRQLRDGKMVAVDIQKAEPFSDAELQIIRQQIEMEKHRQGVITRYFPSQRQGLVDDGGSDFSFTLEDVSDAELKQCLLQLPDPAGRRFRVIFAAVRRGGKPFAENIRLLEPLREQDKRELTLRATDTAEKQNNPFFHLSPWPLGVSRDGWYLQAQQERLRGDPTKAVDRYIKAIRAQDRLESSVSDLVSLYLQLHQDDNAIMLMKAFEKVLPEEKAVNNWITIYDRTKSNDPLLLSLYEKVLRSPLKVNTRLHYLIKQAQLLTRMGRYEASMAAFAQWEELAIQAERGYMSSSGWEQVPISEGLRSLVARGRAICLYHLGQKEEARTIAAQLVTSRPDDTAAQQILAGTLEAASESSLSEQALDTPVSAYENLAGYARELLDQLSIQSVMRVKSIEDDKFTGDIQQARRDLENYEKNTSGIAPKARSDRQLAAAKLILRCLQRENGRLSEEDAPKFNESYFETLLGSGLCSFGDAQLQESRPVQSVRYSYLQAIPLLQHRSGRSQDLVNAVSRYISSYFLPYDRLRESTARPESIDRCVRLFAEQPCPDTGAFLRGMFFLTAGDTTYKNTLLSALYQSPLKQQILSLLCQVLVETDENIRSQEDFEKLWEQASSQWLEDYRSFCGIFSPSRLDYLSSVRMDGLKRTIAQSQAAMLPDESDRQILSEFLQLMVLFERFSSLSEFELREQALRSVSDLCVSLSARITRNPTAFTYEALLGAVNLASQTASSQLEEIYNESRPSLTLQAEETISSAEGQLSLPLFIENSPNLQTADNLRVLVEPEEGIQFQRIDGLKGHVKGGTREGIILSFSMAPGDNRSAFSVTVTVTYEYRESGSTRTGELKRTFPVSISDAVFKPIKNPFRAYASQQEVEDPEMFFGRDKDIADIIRIISDEDGNLTPKKSVALYGQKRTGKSSLLYHARERIRRDFPQAVLLDLGSLGAYDTANNNFTKSVMGGILSKLRRAVLLDRRYSGLKTLLKEKGLEIPYQQMMDATENYDVIFKSFMDDLDWVIRESGVPYRIIIFIDEFTHLYGHIQKGLVTDQFLRFWRESVHDHSWISIIVGQDSMETLKAEYGNELGATAMFPVTYLKPEEARRMIRVPISRQNPEVRFSEDAVDRLVELTAGSAYLLMILCAELVDYLNEVRHNNVIAAHIDQLVDRVFTGGVITASNFDPLYNDVSCPGDERRRDDNFTLLVELARRTRLAPAVSMGQLTPEGLTPARTAELLKTLEARGVVKVEQNQYSIVVGLFKEWLINRYGDAL